MAKTLGQRLDAVQDAIALVEQGQEYKIADRELKRVSYSQLTQREDKLIHKINMYGRDYIEGQNTTPLKMQAHVQFSS